LVFDVLIFVVLTIPRIYSSFTFSHESYSTGFKEPQ
jgi:hypothetical protein